MIKKFLILWLISLPAMAFTIPEHLTQGMFVFGTADKGEDIYFEDLKVPVYNGKYVFALGRDTPAKINITVKRGWFSEAFRYTYDVTPREWQKDVFDGVPPQTITPSKKQRKRIAKEQKMLNEARARRPIEEGFPTCFLKPVQERRISSNYGSYRVINGVAQRPHSGVDLAAPEGTEVKATADGVVVLAQKDLFYTGGTIIIEHGSGVQSGYSHLSKVGVKNGDVVRQGDVIGQVGMTGRATGPHLHFTLSWENIRVAPEFEFCTSCPCGDK